MNGMIKQVQNQIERLGLILCVWTAVSVSAPAQCANKKYEYIDLSKFSDGIRHWHVFSTIRSAGRLDTADITGIADNLLAYQNEDGGWPKNIDWLAVLDPDSVKVQLSESYQQSTFDNRNTYPQIEYLAAVYLQTGEERYRLGAERGFGYILDHEYAKGGWYGWDVRAITFNDDVMTGIMNLLLDVKEGDPRYHWLSPDLKNKLLKAYDRGLQVILNCQVEIGGKKTAWCQQHDFETHAPVMGRSYEHPSVTAKESCEVILFLMRIRGPDPDVTGAIESSVQWLKEAQISGYRYTRVKTAERPYHQTSIDYDREFVADPSAPPVWARYYDLQQGKPFLSRRDGTIVNDLQELSFERRVGYEWYGYWPERILKAYPEWQKAHSGR